MSKKKNNNMVLTCTNINCPERTGGKCNADEEINKNVEDWNETFKCFYDDNESGGSSRWLATPNTVEIFIKGIVFQHEKAAYQKGLKQGDWNAENLQEAYEKGKQRGKVEAFIEASEIAQHAKATFFVKDEKTKIPLKEVLYELRAAIVNSIAMEAYKLENPKP